MSSHKKIIAETRAWVNRAVIGLNLCPFAKATQIKNQIRYVVTNARDIQALRKSLCEEIRHLAKADPLEIDSTLLIHPRVLTNFFDFNDFLGDAEIAIRELGYEGILQMASFHPQYQFAGTHIDDMSNATNRSPYPILHLLREESVTRAVAAFPLTESIFENNIRIMNALGADGWKALQQQCRTDISDKNVSE